MPPLFAALQYFFFAVLAIGILVRLSIALFRRRAGRRGDAVRSALGPVMGAGAAQSAAYGWTPPRSMDAAPLDRSTETSEFWDRAPIDLPDDPRGVDRRD
ncbi:hypothetical protein [Microbacterium sp. VKM Ac-2923]|uniref:hypothetical protein n=1 Tax=Microbacterium sp. VKM Ac-2923 TaxID=2929476 RepID=UPI001FB1BD37|nr:hypothetical protein [Microbacterium sp. VKM Ac-2923]MCJ1706541.1 hypothetical protein [Microbacterium sp. VKM Ac-2923]